MARRFIAERLNRALGGFKAGRPPGGDLEIPEVQALILFEVYEASGSLLVVTSSLHDVPLEETDIVVRRPWSTAAYAERGRS